MHAARRCLSQKYRLTGVAGSIAAHRVASGALLLWRGNLCRLAPCKANILGIGGVGENERSAFDKRRDHRRHQAAGAKK